jgi:hypothetical protein
MGYFSEIDAEGPYECPESEDILSEEDLIKGYVYNPEDEECFYNYSQGICSGSCKQPFIVEITLNLLKQNLDSFNLQEFKKEKTEEKNGEIITTIKSLKGIFTDESKVIAVIHKTSNPKLLPNNFSDKLENLIDVIQIYEGTSYLLAKTEDKVFSFKIENFNKVKDIIQTIDYEFSIEIHKTEVSKDGKLICFTTTDETRYLISGLISDNSYEEEERIILTKKVEESKPFFDFEPFSKVDWSKLKTVKGSTFEGLCEVLLQNDRKIIDIQAIGKPNAADRGRDFIIIEETFDLSDKKRHLKWLVQCKYSEHSISPNTISGWTDRAIEHRIDGYWLMTNNDITPSLYDQLNDSSKNEKFGIKTRIWSRNKFDIQFNLQKELFSSEFFD